MSATTEQGEATCMLCADEGKPEYMGGIVKFSVEAVEIARDDEFRQTL